MTGLFTKICGFFAICINCFAGWASADELSSPAPDIDGERSSLPQYSSKSSPPESSENTDEPVDRIFDSSHRLISENIISFSHKIDLFFSNARYLEESFGSYGCVTLNLFLSEGGEWDASADICLKIDLPHTKKRWKLIFESEEVEDVGDVLESNAPSITGVEDSENKSSTALLRYVAEEELLKFVSFDVGVKTRTPLDPFTRVRFRRTWVPNPWLFRLTESLYYFKSTEGGFLSRFDAERKFGKDWYARMTTSADYRDKEQQFNLKQVFGFYHRVGKGRALNWELNIVGTSQPNPHVDYYVLRFRYRINVWRDWFFVEAAPQLLYQRENDFDSEAGILFSTQAVFGNY